MSSTIVCLLSNKKYIVCIFYRSVEWPVDRHIQCAGQVKILPLPVAMVKYNCLFTLFCLLSQKKNVKLIYILQLFFREIKWFFF